MKYLKLLMLMLACCLFSCSSGEDDGGGGASSSASFEITESDLVQNFEKDASTASIPVKTELTADAWTVKSNAEWCVAAKSLNGKNINIAVDASEEPVVRTTTVSVTSSVKNYEIKVSQLGYGPAILLKSIPSLTQTVPAEGGEHEIVVTTNVAYAVSAPEVTWVKEMTGSKSSRGFVDYTHKYQIEKNPNFGERSTTLTFSDNREGVKDDEKAKPVTLALTQEALSGKPSDVEVEGDIQFKPTSGKANQQQGSQGIEKTWDGDTNGANDNHYHSPWGDGTKFPVDLEYFFEGEKHNLDYIVYHSRSGNGNFGELDLYVATESEPDYKLYGSYDFKMQNAPSRIDFKETLNGIQKVKFSVKTGTGGYASCAEMQFFQKNTEKTLDAQLLTVFTDLTCSELKENVTEDAINQLPTYFGRLAIAIRDNSYSDYEKEFRIQEYQAYSNPVEAAEKFMIKPYTMLDNPTGITVKEGDEILLLVGDTHGQAISVQNVGEEQTNFGENSTYVQTEALGDSYFLQAGVNKIKINKTGMLFFIYNADLTMNPQPIKVHIPMDCGEVNGYWDLKKHQTNEKYKELIDKSTYKYFCVRGERMMFYFHRDKMKAAVPEDINSAIGLWDDIMRWQHELMGFDDVYPSQMNNHMFAISPEGSYMWASDYRVAFVYTYLENILLKDKVMAAKDNAWGPGHEIGHNHQIAIYWPSNRESSNNLFANFILYKLGKYCSRGWTLDNLAQARLVDGNGWYNLGDQFADYYMGEAPELHMRMFWQLFVYYHRCGYMEDFWPKVFKAMRENRIVETNPGAGQMLFAKACCQVANEDLTDFFEMWGFFKPVDNQTLEQYGTWNYNVTQAMIDETKAYMASFPKKAAPIQYLEDRKYGDVGLGIDSGSTLDDDPGNVGYFTQFKDNQKITKTITHTRSGQSISITNGDEAVAFELYKNDELIYFSTKFNFTVPSKIKVDENVVVKAVQADGVRVEVK